VPQVAIVARVTVKEGMAEHYLAAFAPLLEQARKEPGTLLYAVHRSKDVTIGETLMAKGLGS
jgi:quinol monooxygenase YgiN